MNLAPGDSLSHYRLSERIGAGGMGEVWRAADTTLGREVAIKILPATFASDPERLARFEREAKVLASLSHPGIAGIYGLHEDQGLRFLAMELAHGEDLAERLQRGALPTPEAIEVARQLAEALEAAHEQGVVHRDLKPANIKLASDGRVKILDFGLAKALDPASGSAPAHDATQSPTITSLGTVAGVILGTAAYMSPEQARGKPVDKRSDIWSFGCVLYEMLTGARPFRGETISDTLAAVLAREPDFAALGPAVTGRLRELLRRCLEKDPKKRLRDIGDARIELEEAAREGRAHQDAPTSHAGTIPPASRPAATGSLFGASSSRFIVLVAAAVVVGVAAWAFLRPAAPAAPAPLARLEISRPEGAGRDAGLFAIAPDGSAVVFVIETTTGTPRLSIRDLDRVQAREIPGTDGASFPFWSADSRHIAFFAEGKLKRVTRSGGAVQTICDAPAGRGGSWGSAGVIVFAPTPGSPLSKVDASGGVPERVTTFEASRGESSHRFPSFLPDGRHFLYAALPEVQRRLVQVWLASLDDPHARPLLLSSLGARYVEPGYVVFTRDQALVAQRIDPPGFTLSGDVLSLAELADVNVRVSGTPPVDGARNGTLVYDPIDERATDVVWVGRDGRASGTVLRHAGLLVQAALSHDGVRLAVIERASGLTLLRVADLTKGTVSRLASSDRAMTSPVWTHDDGTIVALAQDEGKLSLVAFDTATGAERPPLVADSLWAMPSSITADGTLVASVQVEGGLYDIYLKPGDGRDHRPYLATPVNETEGKASPDGSLLAYLSDASNRQELYVDGFPDHRRAVRVSTEGASAVMGWRDDGRELYFVAGNGTSVMSCEVRRVPTLEVGIPRRLFDLPADHRGVASAAHGDKFLALLPVGAPPASLVLVQNWASQLDPHE